MTHTLFSPRPRARRLPRCGVGPRHVRSVTPSDSRYANRYPGRRWPDGARPPVAVTRFNKSGIRTKGDSSG
jgi:hypothetical protein